MIDQAASHAIHLMQQGKRAHDAVRHAAFRFGVSQAEIIAEVEARRSTNATLGNEADDLIEDYFAFDTARRYTGDVL